VQAMPLHGLFINELANYRIIELLIS